MKILVDENIPRISVAVLKESGHDVLDLRGTPEEGIPLREQKHSGILLVCLNQPNRVKIHERILWAMTRVPSVVMRDTVQSVWPARTF